VFVAVVAVACSTSGVLIDHLLMERPQQSSRIFLDWKRIPIRDAEVYNLRWIEFGQVHTVDVEGPEARDRVIGWLSKE
jgi:hypothetical protein